MKKRILILGVVLALVMALVIPASALAEDIGQMVTGSSLAPYDVHTTVAFGSVPVSSTAEVTEVITASSGGNTIEIAVPASSVDYIPGRLLSLDYQLVDVSQILITAPGAAEGPYILTYKDAVIPAVMAGDAVWKMVATTGAVGGVWEAVVITVTIL